MSELESGFQKNILLQNTDQTTLKNCEIFLVKEAPEKQCSSWLSISKKGNLSCDDILSFTRIEEIYAQVSEKGISQDLPLLLAQGSEDFAYRMYFFEAMLQQQKLEESSSYMENLCRNVDKLFTDHIGFYLSPKDNVLLSDGTVLLSYFIRCLVISKPSLKFYVLIGDYSYNHVLNILILLKKDLVKERINLSINH